MKETRLINRFSEKILIWAKKMAHPHRFGSVVGIFLHSEKGQYVDESNNNGFHQKKKKIRINGYFGSENGISRNSESVLRIF